MSIDTDIVAREYLNPVAGTPISVDIPATDEGTVYVYLSEAAEVAVQDTDYTIALNTSTYEDFTITPTSSMITKLDALVSSGGTDKIFVRRTLGYLSDMTAELSFFRQKIAQEFDKTIMRFQQVAETLSRCLRFSLVDVGGSTELPDLSSLEGKYLAVVDGNFIGAEGTTVDPVSSTMANFVGSASLADARTELNVYAKSETYTKAEVDGLTDARAAFRASAGATQSVSSSTATKVSLTSESFDTGGYFDSVTAYRFLPDIAGYYQINAFLLLSGATDNRSEIQIRKNGNSYAFSGEGGVSDQTMSVSDVVYLNGTTDYVELYVISYASGTAVVESATMSGHLIGEG